MFNTYTMAPGLPVDGTLFCTFRLPKPKLPSHINYCKYRSREATPETLEAGESEVEWVVAAIGAAAFAIGPMAPWLLLTDGGKYGWVGLAIMDSCCARETRMRAASSQRSPWGPSYRVLAKRTNLSHGKSSSSPAIALHARRAEYNRRGGARPTMIMRLK
eukprot:4210356-Pleurochrysis_carterae.AAC.4